MDVRELLNMPPFEIDELIEYREFVFRITNFDKIDNEWYLSGIVYFEDRRLIYKKKFYTLRELSDLLPISGYCGPTSNVSFSISRVFVGDCKLYERT